MNSPRFSVIIATFNRRELARLAIESVFAQTFTDFEVIVVDDGSSDNTNLMLREFGPKMRALGQSNRGGDVARFNGASIATGEYLVFLDDDDLLYPNALQVYDRIIGGLNAPPLILAAMTYFRNGAPVPPIQPGIDAVEYLLFSDFLAKDVGFGKTFSRIVLKRSAAQAADALRTEPPTFPVDDANLLLLIGTIGPAILVQQPFTVSYRLHDNNTSAKLPNMIRALLFLIKREREGDYPGGAKRRFDRRAFIGGVCVSYLRRTVVQGRFGLAGKLLIHAGPMMLSAAVKKLGRIFIKRIPSRYLPA